MACFPYILPLPNTDNLHDRLIFVTIVIATHGEWIPIPYIPIFYCFVVACLLIEGIGMIISLRGTVADERPRRRMRNLVEIHSVMTLLELPLEIYTLYFTIHTLKTITHLALLILLIISTLLTALLTLLHLLAILALYIVSCPVVKDEQAAYESTQRLWQRRLRRLFSFGGKWVAGQDVMEEVARFFGEYFDGVDLAPSDVLVGLALLRKVQQESAKQHARERRQDAIPLVAQQNPQGEDAAPVSTGQGTDSAQLEDRELSSREDEREEEAEPVPLSPIHQSGRANEAIVDKADLSNALHFLNYAQAIYGLPLTFAENPFSTLKATCGSLCCACCVGCIPHPKPTPTKEVWQAVATEGGLFPFLGTSTDSLESGEVGEDIQTVHKKLHSDLIYISHINSPFRSPFFVSLDHQSRSVVVAVRGTFSTADVLVDLSLQVTDLELCDGGKHWAHTGMLKTAKNLVKEMDKRGVLKRPELEADENGRSKYRVCVVGHSLGAGIAALVCHILRRTSHAGAICYAYSPPGCLLSSDASIHFQQFCTSIILNDDLVPRLSRTSLERAKRDVAYLCGHSNVHKLHVLAAGFGLGWTKRWTRGEGVVECEEDVLRVRENEEQKMAETTSSECIVDLPRQEEVPADDNVQAEAASPTGGTTVEVRKSVQMYVPGTIIHIVRLSPLGIPKARSNKKYNRRHPPPRYTARWADKADFTEILLSRSMLMDHFPYNVRKGLNEALETFTAAEAIGHDVLE
ncbi:uncharacterized protein SPPG_05225 [Spizellomyces punctatus DAOM BR117]|uniref:sn-1-specific diacylglycerol lipase n=1 Tax=Spizellomyces punctatus (strain DAOM BR117) TaxID=645134 RepID=A0A0L0HFP6_SPIPD|nr:uncharacterized protein SPPG_05225 [Spizellomyces punctatus DAOM BR117]KNC99851.1 hypothetical protein SPPG_05225 [Spizellomyces punctatus DAOM BR117]|eukprot:XP_016607891.1 hypothetical protein SPPG_05225 [Spizellomyces punctatus DAOM BR117]